uniref:Putative epithelial chloride channel protein n=1 Tax=Rhipicephalus microplus TaxID=6941 RepID=A0A6M2CKT9_RHIMP
MASRLAVAAALLCLLSCVESLTVDKSDGGYKDLLISIHKDVPYNETIVENIKSLLRSSSDFLHRATNGRVYFKHVMINFPNTWPKRSSARSVSSSWFDKSDVRVDLSGSTAEERPFTKQSRLCGERGDYIKLTPTFVAELNASIAKTFRNPGKLIAQTHRVFKGGPLRKIGCAKTEALPEAAVYSFLNQRFVELREVGSKRVRIQNNCQPRFV